MADRFYPQVVQAEHDNDIPQMERILESALTSPLPFFGDQVRDLTPEELDNLFHIVSSHGETRGRLGHFIRKMNPTQYHSELIRYVATSEGPLREMVRIFRDVINNGTTPHQILDWVRESQDDGDKEYRFYVIGETDLIPFHEYQNYMAAYRENRRRALA